MFFVVLYYFELGGNGLYLKKIGPQRKGLGNTDVVDVYIHPEPNCMWKGPLCNLLWLQLGEERGGPPLPWVLEWKVPKLC